jgi:hypothetical protein
MPRTVILVYRDGPGSVPPLTAWLDGLKKTERKAYVRCLGRIQDLARYGNELRRPTADYLRDGIHELRTKVGRVHYRILYFFCGKNVACLSHGFTKQGAVPDAQIDIAVERRALVLGDRNRFTQVWEVIP